MVLIALGIFLRSVHQPQTYFTFEDTPTQISLGYVFLFLLGFVEESWLSDFSKRNFVRLLAGLGAFPRREP